MGFDVQGVDVYLIAMSASPVNANPPVSGIQDIHANMEKEQLLPGPKTHSSERVKCTCANPCCPIGAAGLRVT